MAFVCMHAVTLVVLTLMIICLYRHQPTGICMSNDYYYSATYVCMYTATLVVFTLMITCLKRHSTTGICMSNDYYYSANQHQPQLHSTLPIKELQLNTGLPTASHSAQYIALNTQVHIVHHSTATISYTNQPPHKHQ